MTAATNSAAGRGSPRSALPWIVLAIGITASLTLFDVIRDAVENVARLRFERQAGDANAVIRNRLTFYADILYGLRALFNSQGPVSRVQFHDFIESLDLKHRYPGIDSLNYAAYVPGPEKERFERAVRADTSIDPAGYPRFEIRPPGQRPEYFVIVYLQPMKGYEFAFGLDLAANPNAADPRPLVTALHAGRDSGTLIASGQPLRIAAAKGGVYLAMRLAVYRNRMPLDTVEQRRSAYLGSVGAGFNIERLMRDVLDESMLKYMRFTVHDAGPAPDAPPGANTGSRRLLVFDSSQLRRGAPAQSAAGDATPMFTHILPVEIAGRIWEFEYSARKDAIMDRVDAVLPWMVLGGGLLSSALLFGMFFSLASSRSRAVAIANEITRDLRASEEELRASAGQLQALSRRLVEVQESERRQFSRELHDRVGQNLTALSISLDILKSQIPGDGNEALRSRLDDAASLLDATAGTIENVMSELRPPMLDDYGLLPALQWYAAEFSGRTGIEVKVHGDERMERLPQASEIALFRIVQEALTNVAKHAHATRVEIGLEHTASGFTLSIWDNGVGLDEGPAPVAGRRQGLGMVTMRERTQSAGGRFEIRGASGGGTRVLVQIPRQ